MRPASRLLPPRLGAFFETARLRKQGVATMKRANWMRAYPRPHGVGERWIGPKDRDGEGDFLAQWQARAEAAQSPCLRR